MARHGVPRRPVSPAKIQRAKELRREMTRAEDIVWQHVRRSQLHGLHFYRQHVIAGFIVDFYCPAGRLVVELDGAIHEGQAEYDWERDQVLAGYGLTVLRVANDDVERDVAAVLARIATACGVGS